MHMNHRFHTQAFGLQQVFLATGWLMLQACSAFDASDERGVVTAPGTASEEGGTQPLDDAGAGPARPPDDRGERPRDTPMRDSGAGEVPDASTPKDSGTAPPLDAGPPPPSDVPDGAHCAPVRNIDPKLAELERQVLVLINRSRARGEYCGREGDFDPTEPLVMQKQLRCASRLHSAYMAKTNDFAHTTRDGVNVGDRIVATGYRPWLWGENIASGQSSAENAVADWLYSDGHCRNLMDPDFTETGIGLAYGELDGERIIYWTQNFATP